MVTRDDHDLDVGRASLLAGAGGHRFHDPIELGHAGGLEHCATDIPGCTALNHGLERHVVTAGLAWGFARNGRRRRLDAVSGDFDRHASVRIQATDQFGTGRATCQQGGCASDDKTTVGKSFHGGSSGLGAMRLSQGTLAAQTMPRRLTWTQAGGWTSGIRAH
ncbi:MAG: hypothetical protein ACK559_06630, partial [bacterium]